MIKQTVIAFLFPCAFFSHKDGQAQVNYVLNPSFEEYDTCPYNLDQIKFAKYWAPIDTLGNPAIESTLPLCSPEYCNTCASLLSQVNVPQEYSGYHYAHTGSGLAEVQMYFNESFSQPYQRDYLQGHLYKPLTVGKSYCVTFYVTLTLASGYAINHIGAYLDDGSIDTTVATDTDCAQPQTKYTPQVIENSIIIDTFHWSFFNDSSDWDRTWVKIQGSFVANGTERYVTIGTFFDAAHIDTIGLHIATPWGEGNIATWYLVDDVSVIESDNLPSAGNDTSIAKGDSVFLGPHEIALPYWWYIKGEPSPIDSGGGIWVKPDSTTTYVLEQNLCGVLSYDTVVVSVLPKNNSVVTLGTIGTVVVYPNPARNFINVENLGKGEVRIFDVVGQEVFYARLNSNKQQLDISKLIEGTYLLQITANDGSRKCMTIVKER